MKLKEIPRNTRVKLEEVVPLTTPFTIQIDPCGACNMICNFCPCNTVEEKKKERHAKMSLSLFQKTVDEIAVLPEKIKKICVAGFGEPLLNQEVPEMICYLKDKNVTPQIELVTNGLLLTPEYSDRLVDSGLDLLRISLNGFTAEEYKKTCGVTIDFDQFYENLAYFFKVSRGKTQFSIKGTTAFLTDDSLKQNFSDLFYEMTDFLVIHDIYAQWPDFEVELTDNNESSVHHFNWMDKKKICVAPLINMMIHANGDVSPCCSDWRHDVVYGNVKENTVGEIWRGAQLKALRLSLLRQEKGVFPFCDTCSVRNIDNVNDVADMIIQRVEELT